MTPSPEPVRASSPLESCDSCGMVLDLADMLPLTVVECPGCKNAITVLKRFGQFRLEGLLGTGGMGAVYKAFDLALQRSLALKILQRTWSHDALLTAQFEKEAALTARVNHPNVVRVYSTGKAHGMFYIAMELVDCGSLDSVMEEKGRLPEVEVLQVGIQVAEGLEAATRAGLIHRDIKPGNILFAENGRAKIVDFGLALQSNQAEANLGEIWGTPFYVSPETLASKPEDFRSDMYALGSSLWHALTGVPPYPSTSTSIHELFHLKKHPVDLASAFAGLHPRTVGALNRTLAPDPADRFPDYSALAAELRAAFAALAGLEDPAALAPPPTIKSKGRGRKVAALFGFFALLGAGAGFWWLKQREKEPTDQLATPAEQTLIPDEERLAKTCTLLAMPAQLDFALRRLELVSHSPELRTDLRVWTAVALGTGYALSGDPARQTAAFENLPEDLPPASKTFVQRLKAVGNASRGSAPEPALSQEEQTVVLLWQALAKISQDSPETALPMLLKAASVTSGPPFVRQLLSFVPILAKDVGTLLAMEKEFLNPNRTASPATRIQQAEGFQAVTHPILARSKRMAALVQNAKNVPPEAPEGAPTKAPAPESAATTSPYQSVKPASAAAPPQKNISLPADTAADNGVLRTQLPLQILAFQFRATREKAAAFTPTTERQHTQKALILRQTDEVETLFLWCLQQINQGGTLPSPIMRNGAPFKSDPVRADERTLYVKPDAKAPAMPIPWQEISPLFLVKLLQFRGASVQKPAQRAQLLWSAGTIHYLLGSKKNASDFFEEAAKLNPAYRATIATLSSEASP